MKPSGIRSQAFGTSFERTKFEQFKNEKNAFEQPWGMYSQILRFDTRLKNWNAKQTKATQCVCHLQIEHWQVSTTSASHMHCDEDTKQRCFIVYPDRSTAPIPPARKWQFKRRSNFSWFCLCSEIFSTDTGAVFFVLCLGRRWPPCKHIGRDSHARLEKNKNKKR